MKNSFRGLSILMLMFCLLIATKNFAAEQEYDSNGKTSFFGKYEYEDEEQENQGSNKTKPDDFTGLNNYSEDGRVVLPRTGDYVSPIYSQIGSIMLVVIGGFIFIKKRNEGNNL